MSTVSIVGCGWYGLPLGKYLAESHYTVKGSTTRVSKFSELSGNFIQPYPLQLDPIPEDFDPKLFDCDICVVNIPPSNPDRSDKFARAQLLFIRQQLVRQAVKKVIFISSTGVYPDLNREGIEKDAAAGQRSRSGIELLPLEEIFESESSFSTTVIRFAGLYGGDRHPVKYMIGREVPNGLAPVNMIHLEDCIGVTEAIIENDLWGETFNACSPDHPTRKDFYTRAAKELNLSPPAFLDEKKAFKIVSPAKLIEATGYRFKH
jgi:nucleoside-diphosphate-sugar epimerase